MNYYENNKTFINLPNVDQKSELELTQLCQSYSNYTIEKEINSSIENQDNQNFSISELQENKLISHRSFNICRRNGFEDLTSILNYYKYKKTFLYLTNVGNKTEFELKQLCLLYLNNSDEDEINYLDADEDIKNLTLLDILHKKLISIRAYNICKRIGLTDLKSIIYYYKINKTFINLPNSGAKTEFELKQLCILYTTKTIEDEINTISENKISTSPLQLLTTAQLTTLNSICILKLNSLSIISQNFIQSHIDEDITFDTLYKIFIKGNKVNFRKLPNLSLKDNNELFNYFSYLQDAYVNIIQIKDEFLVLHTFMEWINWKFNVKSHEFEPFKQACLDDRFPLFKFIEFLINNEKIFSKNKNFIIFYHRSGYFKNIELEPYETLGRKFGLSRERVRQISVKACDQFEAALSSLETQEILLKKITAYEWDYDSDLIFTSDEYNDKLNKVEGTNFETTFITKVVSNILKSTHKYFYSNEKSELSNYCIKKELTEFFDFESMWKDVFTRVSGNIHQELIINFEEYLLGFCKSGRTELVNRIVQVCHVILDRDYPNEIYFDLQRNIIFHRNTHVKLAEYVVQVLENENRPMHIKKIYSELMKIHPKYSGDHNSLRGTINRENIIFIYFGRNSTYGLREWEHLIKGIKGGTIRSITEEYLEQFDEPKHISEIEAYVLKYRPKSTEGKIISNLYLERNNKFIYFNSGFWGLSSKNYSKEKTRFNYVPKNIDGQCYSYLKINGSTSYNELISHFCNTLGLKEVQIDYYLKKLLDKSKISISESNIVNLVTIL